VDCLELLAGAEDDGITLLELSSSDNTLSMSEIIFEVREDEVDSGCLASALGYGIHTQSETLEELRAMVREGADCFDETIDAPKLIRLHFVRDEVLAR